MKQSIDQQDICKFCQKKNCKCTIPTDDEKLETIYTNQNQICIEVIFSNKLDKNLLPGCHCQEYDDSKVCTPTDASSSKHDSQNPSIYDCLNLFTKPEILGEDNCWFCPQCKKQQQAEKTLQIFRAPPILIVHLKRFKSNKMHKLIYSVYQDYSKINQKVDFSQELDLSSYILSNENLEKQYELYAYVNHFGGAGGGHYTACALNQKVQQWVNFDDSRKSLVNQFSDLETSDAYVLFYRRKNLNEKDLNQIYEKLQHLNS